MTWTIQKNGKLEITFCKANIGMIWQRFLKQQNETEIIDGEEVMDPNMVEQIHSQFTTKSADVIEHSEQTKSIESNIANMELNKITTMEVIVGFLRKMFVILQHLINE